MQSPSDPAQPFCDRLRRDLTDPTEFCRQQKPYGIDTESESWPEYLEYARNVRVNLSLLRDSYHEGTSPWDVAPIVL